MILSKEQFQNEVDYGTAMLLIREMMDAGLINKSEYIKIDKMYIEKYQPFFRQDIRQE